MGVFEQAVGRYWILHKHDFFDDWVRKRIYETFVFRDDAVAMLEECKKYKIFRVRLQAPAIANIQSDTEDEVKSEDTWSDEIDFNSLNGILTLTFVPADCAVDGRSGTGPA